MVLAQSHFFSEINLGDFICSYFKYVPKRKIWLAPLCSASPDLLMN